ncbi:MAG: hypothetical protein LBI96_02500 [Odoribacteraceae bacterium]|nr:hypothetical protein [Odoribacteraceae bacterium]
MARLDDREVMPDAPACRRGTIVAAGTRGRRRTWRRLPARARQVSRVC